MLIAEDSTAVRYLIPPAQVPGLPGYGPTGNQQVFTRADGSQAGIAYQFAYQPISPATGPLLCVQVMVLGLYRF